MSKKSTTQLSRAREIISAYEMPLTAASRKEIRSKIVAEFGCTEQTAYYYYFYKTMKAMQAEGTVVSQGKTKAAVKKLSKEKTTKQFIADLPAEMQAAMAKKSPFAALGV